MTEDQQAEAIRLLDLIVAEWNTDPMSVACFDLRIVSDAKKFLEEVRNPGS